MDAEEKFMELELPPAQALVTTHPGRIHGYSTRCCPQPDVLAAPPNEAPATSPGRVHEPCISLSSSDSRAGPPTPAKARHGAAGSPAKPLCEAGGAGCAAAAADCGAVLSSGHASGDVSVAL